MSTGLLERFVVALETIAANGSVGAKAPAAGAATPPKAPAANAAAAGKAADAAATKKAADEKAAAAVKAKADAAAKAAAAAKAKPGAAPAGNTKAPGGKYNAEQVRDIIRKVANNPTLGKQSAREALETDGGGVTTVSELKPEFFDAVYEACQVLLNGEGGGAAAPDDFDPTA